MTYEGISQIENIDINFARCIRIRIKDRFRIEKDIEILRFENKFIDRVEAFFINDIVFKNNMQ